jgi:hypothetical protein
MYCVLVASTEPLLNTIACSISIGLADRRSLVIGMAGDGRWAAGGGGIHTGFRTITLVLYIGSLPNLAT